MLRACEEIHKFKRWNLFERLYTLFHWVVLKEEVIIRGCFQLTLTGNINIVYFMLIQTN